MGMTKTCHDLLDKGPWVGERHRRFFPSFVARCRDFDLATARGRRRRDRDHRSNRRRNSRSLPGDYFSTPSPGASVRGVVVRPLPGDRRRRRAAVMRCQSPTRAEGRVASPSSAKTAG
jgi:hypothetical protein